MAFDPDELHAHVLEEFGMELGDVWQEQASAAQDYERQRKARRAAWSTASGTCLDCYAPADTGKKRCVRCLAKRVQVQNRYMGRLMERGIYEATKAVLAERIEARRRK